MARQLTASQYSICACAHETTASWQGSLLRHLICANNATVTGYTAGCAIDLASYSMALLYAWTNHICARRAERALHPVGTECWQSKLQSRHHRTHTSDNYMHRAGVARPERGSNRGPHSDGLRRADDILQRRDPGAGGMMGHDRSGTGSPMATIG